MKRWPAVAALAWACAQPVLAEQPPLALQVVETPAPSVFPTLLRLRFFSESLQPVDLSQAWDTATLWVDGQAHRGKPMVFSGIAGVAPFTSWEACLDLQQFEPPVTPGRHKIWLEFAGAQSDRQKIDWQLPRSSATWTAEVLEHDTQRLTALLKPGLPRQCVEVWLPIKDGGPQTPTRTRYYVPPKLKIEVPYDESGGAGGGENHISGPVRLYHEARLLD